MFDIICVTIFMICIQIFQVFKVQNRFKMSCQKLHDVCDSGCSVAIIAAATAATAAIDDDDDVVAVVVVFVFVVGVTVASPNSFV